MDPRELIARMKQFAQEQEDQAMPHLKRIDDQFKLQPGYTQGMVEDMASSSGGIQSLIGKARVQQAAVKEFQALKKAIQERGKPQLISEEQLINSYPKDTMTDAEKLLRREKIDRNLAIDMIEKAQEAEKKIKHPGSQDITKIIDN